MKLPIVAIIGQPNAGKSALFNKLIGKRYSIIADEPGTTRDRIYQKLETPSQHLLLVDTGGILFESTRSSLENDIQNQAKLAVEEADIILFVISSKHSMTSGDYAIAEILRKRKDKKKKIFVVLTKCDTCDENITEQFMDIYTLGLDKPLLVSAFQNWGVDDLKKIVVQTLKKAGFRKESKKMEYEFGPKIAIIGKPNVGKSSLVNALLRENKILVSAVPGTTRDTIDTHIEFNKKKYNFIDTAGVRRRGKISRGIEKFSVMRTVEAVVRSDIVLLTIDGSKNITKQDQHVAEELLKQNKGLILVINKWDLREKGEEERDQYIRQLRRRFVFTPWAPVIFVSAKTKRHLTKIFPLADAIMQERQKRIPTAKLNQFIKKIISKHPPSGTKRRRPSIKYITQAGIDPPQFVLFVNDRKAFHFSYKRYLENRIREAFGYTGTAVDILMRDEKR